MKWLVAVILAAAGALVWASTAGRHLAVPVLSDPSDPAQLAFAALDLPECHVERFARVPSRVTGLIVVDGTVFAATFDHGLFAGREGALTPVGELQGRERFVNALASYGGRLFAATHGGALVFDSNGRRLATLAAEVPMEALVELDGRLYAGTAKGLYRLDLDTSTAAAVALAGPDGEQLRVAALAAGGELLWIGTSAGVYSVPKRSLASVKPATRARWHPLVFGSPAADTNVATALAPLGSGAVAGTDDGGPVLLGPEGEISARRLDLPAANAVNPGAALAADGGVWLGTQAGLVFVGRDRRVGRPRAWIAG